MNPVYEAFWNIVLVLLSSSVGILSLSGTLSIPYHHTMLGTLIRGLEFFVVDTGGDISSMVKFFACSSDRTRFLVRFYGL